MGSTSVFLNENTYFHYFESKYTENNFYKKYPLLTKKIKELCKEIKYRIQNSQKEDFFQIHAEIMGLDAQLQIILLLVDLLETDSMYSDILTEEYILECSKKDYATFFQENCQLESKETIEHSLYFSVI